VTNEIVKSGPVVGRHIKIHIRYNIPICGKWRYLANFGSLEGPDKPADTVFIQLGIATRNINNTVNRIETLCIVTVFRVEGIFFWTKFPELNDNEMQYINHSNKSVMLVYGSPFRMLFFSCVCVSMCYVAILICQVLKSSRQVVIL
jgi:hypothetical protein